MTTTVYALDVASGPVAPAQPLTETERVELLDLLDDLERYCQDAEDSMHGTIAIDFVRRFVNDIRAALAPQAPSAQPLTWQSIETMPKDNRRAIFWVVPKTAEESWLNTSGGPVLATGNCHMHVGTYQSWGSLYKATHWMPLPIAPPAQAPAAQPAPRNQFQNLQAFAQAIMNDWPDVGGLDGFELQMLGIEHGLLREEIMHEPCGETCRCVEYSTSDEWQAGVKCYRKTELLTGIAPPAQGEQTGEQAP